MQRSQKTLIAAIASIGLGLGVSFAHGQDAATSTAAQATHQGAHHAGKPGRDGMSRRGDSAERKAAGDARSKVMEQLTTLEERTALREQMRAASPEQRRLIAAEYRGVLEQRATERGVTLPETRGPRNDRATAQGRHDGQRSANGQARREAAQKLSTPEERTAFREQMRAATPEQRQQLAAANRVELEQRAKAQGVSLPEAHAQRPGRGQGHGERGQHRHDGRTPGSAAPTMSN